jgi:hypothetical protein
MLPANILDMSYKRTLTELQTNASYWWPRNLQETEADASIIPLLLKTQNAFVSLLKISGKSPLAIFDLLANTEIPGNLFLKHLIVLSDYGGEPLQRLNSTFDSVFPKNAKGKRYLKFVWKETEHSYQFTTLPIKGLNNKKLGLDGSSLVNPQELSSLHKDVAAILLFGSTSIDESIANTLLKCEIGTLLGLPDEIDTYVDQRYLWVSRITGGAQANTLGQIAQTHVVEYLQKELEKEYVVTRNGRIGTNNGYLTFDVVVEKVNLKVGIEVSFQVTTNSTIERKANEAENRYKEMSEAGHPVAYVIDGAGNFQRSSAVTKICENSDCTVAYSDEELKVLANFIRVQESQ